MKLFKEPPEFENFVVVDDVDDDDDCAATESFPRGLCQRLCDAKFAGQLNT